LTEKHVGRRIAVAMITIFVFQLFWKFGGFIVKTLVFREFATRGSKHIFDAYTFAEATIIWTVYVLFDKFIFPTFLPLFSDERELHGETQAWKFANSFVNVLVPLLLVTIVACMTWTRPLVNFVAPGWRENDPLTAGWAVRLCHFMLPALLFVVVGSFTHALLNSYKRFALASAGLGMHRFVHAGVFVLAFWVFGAPALWAALAFYLSAPAKLLTHAVGLRDKLHHYRPVIPYWREIARPVGRWLLELAVVEGVVLLVVPLYGPRVFLPGERGFVPLVLFTAVGFFALRGLIVWLQLGARAEKTLMQRLFLLGYPVLMGVVVARLRDVVQDMVATNLAARGLFGTIKYAKSVGEFPTAILPLALSMAMFPFLCDMFTRQNLEALSETVAHALKMVALFFLPLTVLTVVLRRPVIELLASKEVTQDLIAATALALGLYALGFVFYACEMILMQTYFSLQNTWLPTLIGAVASFGQIGFLWLALRLLGPDAPDTAARAWLMRHGITLFLAVAAAYPLSRMFKNVILGGVLHFRLKLFHVRDTASYVPQIVLVSAAAGLMARVWRPWGAWAKWSLMRRLIALGGPFEVTTTWEVDKEIEMAAQTGAPSELTVLLGRAVGLAIPSVAALAAFLLALLLLRRIGWPMVEFDMILRWLRETGWGKIKARLRGRKQA
jgi:peptidoglycan biosynthesis protein MviN/MurJ (putative lipid II flippase)